MQLRLRLSIKLVVVIILVVFITSFLLIFTEIRERNTLIKNQFKATANILDTWLYTTGAVPNAPDLDKKLHAVLENMVYYTQESGSRFDTGIKEAAIYDSNGQLLTSTLSKMIENRVKGENYILTAFEQLKPKDTKFRLRKVLNTDIVANIANKKIR